MNNPILNIRCRYSKQGLERLPWVRHKDRLGIVVAESKDSVFWIVLWDGINTKQKIRKIYIDLLQKMPSEHYDYKTDEIMRPRVMCLMEYPHSFYKVGEIIKPSVSKYKSLFSKYPHIFRPMFWAENRMQYEMPRYVRITRNYLGYREDEIYMVCEPHEDSRMRGCITILVEDDIVAFIPHSEKLIIPATEQEYNDYHDQ